MKLLLVIVAVAVAGYLGFRLLLRLGRPLYLQNAFREIDELYTKLLGLVEGELESAIERHNTLKSGKPPAPLTEGEQLEEVNGARKARDREREINDRFLRLRIRFADDLKRQAEAAAAYRAYLRLRLYKEEFASTAGLVGTGADLSPGERLAHHQRQYEEARKIAVAVEESEKRLDALLS